VTGGVADRVDASEGEAKDLEGADLTGVGVGMEVMEGAVDDLGSRGLSRAFLNLFLKPLTLSGSGEGAED
jgi:hypothetical protein